MISILRQLQGRATLMFLFSGQPLSDETPSTHGSFVYEWQSAAAAPMAYSVIIAPPPPGSERRLSNADEDANKAAPLTVALRSLRAQSEAAEDTKRKVGGILRKQRICIGATAATYTHSAGPPARGRRVVDGPRFERPPESTKACLCLLARLDVARQPVGKDEERSVHLSASPQ